MNEAIDIFCLMAINLAFTIKEVTTSDGDAQDQSSDWNEENDRYAELGSSPE